VKLIVFSDLHLREETADVCLKEVLPGIREAASEPYTDVAFLGDWYHIRYSINVSLMNAVRDELRKWEESGIDLYLIPGNHDQVDIKGRHALEVFDDMEHVHVFTEPTQSDWGLWLPYRKNLEELRGFLKPGQTVWMHQGVCGARMNNGHVNEDGLTVQELEALGPVFSGHYHNRQKVGRAVYVGSPYQTRADEHGQPKGYGIWDGTTMELVDTRWGPRYHIFTVQAGQEPDLTGVDDGDDVRVQVVGPGAHRAAEELGEHLAKSRNVTHAVTPVEEPMESRLEVAHGASLHDYAVAYLERMAKEHGLDEGQLLKTLNEIVEGTDGSRV